MGIDPGTRITGYGIISTEGTRQKALDFGCIRPKISMKLSEKYFAIYSGISELINKFNPDALVVETQYISKNPQSALKLGMARGSIIIAAKQKDIPIFEYAPSKAKLAVVGHGGASKAQVQGMVKLVLGLAMIPEPEDAADALALAICHAHSSKHAAFAACEM